jgi:hypothetical protein
MIKKILTIIGLLVYASTSAAYTQTAVEAAGWNKLTPAQQADIQKQIALAAEAQSVPMLDIKKVDDYVTLGEHIGKMMGGAAKEVGVAVNTFVETPVGKWTMAMIVWKFMGSAIMHIFGGITVLIVGFTYLSFLLRHRKTVEIQYRPELFLGLFNRKLSVKQAPMDDEDIWFFTIAGGVVIILFLVTTFTSW